MKIETKYDIGQEVFTHLRGLAEKGIVKSIHIRVYRDKRVDIMYNIYSVTGGYSQKYENELFPTKEELLKSL